MSAWQVLHQSTGRACRPIVSRLCVSVAVALEDGRVVLSPARPHYTLAEMLSGMKPGDLPTALGG